MAIEIDIDAFKWDNLNDWLDICDYNTLTLSGSKKEIIAKDIVFHLSNGNLILTKNTMNKFVLVMTDINDFEDDELKNHTYLKYIHDLLVT